MVNISVHWMSVLTKKKMAVGSQPMAVDHQRIQLSGKGQELLVAQCSVEVPGKVW